MFHAQQAAEKALKTWCCLVDVTYPKIHDPEALIGLLEDARVDVPVCFRWVVDLTDYAVWARHEPAEMLGAEVNRDDMLEQVTRLLRHVGGLLGPAPTDAAAPCDRPATG